MAYLGTHIPVNLTGATFQGPFVSIPVNLVGALAPEPCAGQWKPIPANQIDFDLNIGWSPRDHDAVNFSFSCSVDCAQAWIDHAGWRVPLTFSQDWTDLDGNLVPLSFACDDTGGPADNTFFPGSFNFESGESVTFELQTSWVLQAREGGYTEVTLYVPERNFSAGAYTGETGSAQLENDIRVSPEFGEGASIGGCKTINTQWASGSSTGTAGSVGTPSYLRLPAATSFYSGWVALTQKDHFSARWTAGIPTAGSSGNVYFGFFDAASHSSIALAGGPYDNRNPFIVSGNPPSFGVTLPLGSGSVDGASWQGGSSWGTSQVAFTKHAGINLFNGSTSVAIELIRETDNSPTIVIHADGVELTRRNFPGVTYPTHAIGAWNYSNGSGGSIAFEGIRECEPDFLTTFPAKSLDVPVIVGESLEASLATTDSLNADGYDGGYSEANLTTIAALTMVANGYAGETASALLNTDQSLDGITGYTGEVLSVILTDNPVWTPTLGFYTGETGSAALRTQVAFQLRAEEGSSFVTDLTDNPAPEMLLSGQTGETVTVSLFISEAIGTFGAYVGEAAVVTGLDLDQFYAVATGESASANIAPTYNLPSNGYEGARASFDLDLRPSEPLGIFRAYTGESWNEAALNTQVAVYLYPNPIRATQEMFCEFTATTSFDLLQTGCCPDFTQDSHEKIELNDMPEMDVKYSGDRTLVTADLSTRPRFTFNFHDGANFRGINPNYLGTFYAQTGENLRQDGAWATEKLDIKLCIGNLIPNGGFINVELISIYDENCPADIFSTGESMEVVLNNTVQDSPQFYEGATMFADLTTSEIILIRAYSGEYVRVSNPEFVPSVHEGAYSSISFWEPNWYGYEGARVEARLTTEYDVEFLENGCLDNEFVPSDENGDPDWDNFHRTPVEMEMYVHSIKARCF